jgi:hypothetical protein
VTNLHICVLIEFLYVLSWTSVFEDIESGINHYEWFIGSQPGYYDIMERVMVMNEECGQSDKTKSLELLDGHSYYINVQVTPFIMIYTTFYVLKY